MAAPSAGLEALGALSVPLRCIPRENTTAAPSGMAFSASFGAMLNPGGNYPVLMSPPPATEPPASRLRSVASTGTLERFAAGLEMMQENSTVPAFPSLSSETDASACPSHPLLDRCYRYAGARRPSTSARICVVHRHRAPLCWTQQPRRPRRQPKLDVQPTPRRTVCVTVAEPQPTPHTKHLPKSFSMSVSLADPTPAVVTPTITVPASEPPDSRPARPVHEQVLAGAAAGAAVSCSMYPLNTLKTRLMSGSAALTGDASIFRHLWRGSRFDMVAQATATAVFFSAYSQLQQRLDHTPASGDSRVSGWNTMLAGMGGAMAASLVAVPAEVVRSHVQTCKYPTTQAAMRGILQSKGMRGLYRGYTASLARDLPFDTMQITIFEVLRCAYASATRRSTSHLSAQETAGLGFMSGGITGVVTTPIDVVRTHMMLSGGTTSPLSFGTATVNTVRSKGLRGLFRGGAMRSLEIALGGAVFFSVLQAATALIQGVPTDEAHSIPDTVVLPPVV